MNILRPSVIRQSEWFKERNQQEWERTKYTVLLRDRYTCTYCRYCCKKFTQVNHIGSEDDHSLENLETVCRACRSVLHLGISCMHGGMSVFECTSKGQNVAAIVCITRSLVAKGTPWVEIEQHVLMRFGKPGGKHYTPDQSVGWANRLLHDIPQSGFRGYLPEGLSVMFHEEGEWNEFPEKVWKWQILAGSGYRKASS